MTPETATAPDFPSAPVVTGGVERLHVTWTAPNDGGRPITSYGVRYRPVGAVTWSCAAGTAPACATGSTAAVADVAPWPAPLAGGRYEVQIMAVNALGTGLWGPSGTAVVSPLTQTASVASSVVYPFVDGYRDT
ncbi:MAG: fibronectin type III domain-containing protein, partial [Aquirufa sp.]